MNVLLIAFGKLKAPGLREAADYYQRNLGRWVSFTEIELRPVPVTDRSEAARKLVQEKEADLLFETLGKRVSPRGRYYVLDESGKALPTLRWGELVREWEDSSLPEVALCIGGSLGFSERVLKGAAGKLALGPQTLAHELARVVLSEQLYRAWSLNRGHPYHNE